jgi:hypothetical protein
MLCCKCLHVLESTATAVAAVVCSAAVVFAADGAQHGAVVQASSTAHVLQST